MSEHCNSAVAAADNYLSVLEKGDGRNAAHEAVLVGTMAGHLARRNTNLNNVTGCCSKIEECISFINLNIVKIILIFTIIDIVIIK